MQDWKRNCFKYLLSLKIAGRRQKKVHDTIEVLSLKEEILCLTEGIGIVIIFAYFFYQSFISVLLLSPFIYFYRKNKKRKIRKKRQDNAESEFKEVLLSVKTNLQAGYSLENAFIESRKDLVQIYGENSVMAEEMERVRLGIKNGISLEKLLTDLGRRWRGEIGEFASIYQLASGTGGRWNEIITSTVNVITKKIEIKEEIKILIHEKKTEHKMMCIIPFFIMFYMNLTSGNYFHVLYHNIFGVIVMTIAMMIYIYAYRLGEVITSIGE